MSATPSAVRPPSMHFRPRGQACIARAISASKSPNAPASANSRRGGPSTPSRKADVLRTASGGIRKSSGSGERSRTLNATASAAAAAAHSNSNPKKGKCRATKEKRVAFADAPDYVEAKPILEVSDDGTSDDDADSFVFWWDDEREGRGRKETERVKAEEEEEEEEEAVVRQKRSGDGNGGGKSEHFEETDDGDDHRKRKERLDVNSEKFANTFACFSDEDVHVLLHHADRFERVETYGPVVDPELVRIVASVVPATYKIRAYLCEFRDRVFDESITMWVLRQFLAEPNSDYAAMLETYETRHGIAGPLLKKNPVDLTIACEDAPLAETVVIDGVEYPNIYHVESMISDVLFRVQNNVVDKLKYGRKRSARPRLR